MHTFQTIHSDYDNTGTIYTLTRPLHSIPSWIYDPLRVALASLVVDLPRGREPREPVGVWASNAGFPPGLRQRAPCARGTATSYQNVR